MLIGLNIIEIQNLSYLLLSVISLISLFKLNFNLSLLKSLTVVEKLIHIGLNSLFLAIYKAVRSGFIKLFLLSFYINHNLVKIILGFFLDSITKININSHF